MNLGKPAKEMDCSFTRVGHHVCSCCLSLAAGRMLHQRNLVDSAHHRSYNLWDRNSISLMQKQVTIMRKEQAR